MDKDSFRAATAPTKPSPLKKGVGMGQDRVPRQEGQSVPPGCQGEVVGIQYIGGAADTAAMDAE